MTTKKNTAHNTTKERRKQRKRRQLPGCEQNGGTRGDQSMAHVNDLIVNQMLRASLPDDRQSEDWELNPTVSVVRPVNPAFARSMLGQARPPRGSHETAFVLQTGWRLDGQTEDPLVGLSRIKLPKDAVGVVYTANAWAHPKDCDADFKALVAPVDNPEREDVSLAAYFDRSGCRSTLMRNRQTMETTELATGGRLGLALRALIGVRHCLSNDQRLLAGLLFTLEEMTAAEERDALYESFADAAFDGVLCDSLRGIAANYVDLMVEAAGAMFPDAPNFTADLLIATYCPSGDLRLFTMASLAARLGDTRAAAVFAVLETFVDFNLDMLESNPC